MNIAIGGRKREEPIVEHSANERRKFPARFIGKIFQFSPLHGPRCGDDGKDADDAEDVFEDDLLARLDLAMDRRYVPAARRKRKGRIHRT